MIETQRSRIDDIFVLWLEPQKDVFDGERPLVIWLPGFGGDKEGVLPQLRALAEAGFVALSFDPFQHGERRIETNDELVARIVGNIRRHFWPILERSAQDTSRVLDWAQERFKLTACGIGGISMGGDIAVAAAGLDARFSVVAACVATADWMRLGSHEPPGTPDTFARWCFYRANPLTNVQRYEHRPAITFQSGENDTQVPPDGGARFVETLRALHPDCARRFEVQLHAETSHQFTDAMWKNCLAWFEKWLAPDETASYEKPRLRRGQRD